jgi:hypothetical protein
MGVLLLGCAHNDRCVLSEPRYGRMKRLFMETGSYQRVLDSMKDEGWRDCERNEVQFRLRKELFLNDEDFATVPVGSEPVHFGDAPPLTTTAKSKKGSHFGF